ncbi:hypothetical protein SAMN06265222_101776 [Neorhodopirellula lusitana]|uniref:Uncharacterized protein n=1 Tax=Neorhodopirellula lusitana TaxID=445327 RepID=A0ABY1PRF5_9BACT|nr:hypothetical protein SAMN06265222_101776 [Neorhodopirellula lusitana]
MIRFFVVPKIGIADIAIQASDLPRLGCVECRFQDWSQLGIDRDELQSCLG